MNAYKFNNSRIQQMNSLVNYRQRIGSLLEQLKTQLDTWEKKIGNNSSINQSKYNNIT